MSDAMQGHTMSDSGVANRPPIGLLVAVLLTCVTAIGCVGVLWPGISAGISGRRGWVLLASTAFLLLGGVGACQFRTRPSTGVVTALFLCWLGDILGPIDFITGAIAFLVGHIAFAVAFAWRGLDIARTLIAALLLTVSAAGILWWLLPHVAVFQDRVLVFGYLGVISLMVLCATGTRHRPWALSACAAWLFYISDIAVARWRFVSPDPANAFFCYPLYYTACILMAWTPSFWSRHHARGQDLS